MSALKMKKILLGVTGGIAAYKSAVLLRALQQSGASVRVVMTRAAQAFITPLTFQALSGQPVFTELLSAEQESAMNHIELARWADLVLVAPASADFLARLACGMANDLLSTLCLATTAPVKVAPAMNQQMWLNPATQENCQRLIGRGVGIWGPDAGLQACGETGPGRMLEPENLLEQLNTLFSDGPLHGVRVLITAGPTREPIDPVRFIGNRSSGRMGFALAEALQSLGADVRLISGSVALPTPAGLERVDVETATQMRNAVMERIQDCDIFIGVAAVGDYRPVAMAEQKIKKSGERLRLTLEPNPDILAEVAALQGGPFTVGFAAETECLEEYAETKRLSKGVDLIAANQVGNKDGGFESDENALLLLWEGGRVALPMMPKARLAEELGAVVVERYRATLNQRNR
ncbi:MAG: bifunctional phosphopantothenoylcysteine decarboxylase/phosphopantothenate--cysteine ligase CoaBC [Pseudomonadota bacterium]